MNNKTYDEISTSELYEWINHSQNVYLEEKDGEVHKLIDNKYLCTPTPIEKFIEQISLTEKLGFEWKENRSGRLELRTLPLGESFSLLFQSQLIYSEKYIFSEKVELFFRSLILLNLDGHQKCDPNTPFNYGIGGTFASKFNELIVQIRTELNNPDFKKRLKDRVANSRRNFNSAKKYIDALFSKHARLLVLRVDFGYRKDPLLGPSKITLDQAKGDLRHFFNNKRGKTFLSAIKGYMWKLEYGEAKGYHYHLIIIYDGSEHCKDVYLATQICKYWDENITKGQGTSHNCNLNKGQYRFPGIGQIHHTQDTIRENLLYVAAYLTKSEQYIRVKGDQKLKVFQRGMMPRKTLGKSGRPRTKMSFF
nr:inovirus-type Gp2 protein [uncultured Albidiferax sp.]